MRHWCLRVPYRTRVYFHRFRIPRCRYEHWHHAFLQAACFPLPYHWTTGPPCQTRTRVVCLRCFPRETQMLKWEARDSKEEMSTWEARDSREEKRRSRFVHPIDHGHCSENWNSPHFFGRSLVFSDGLLLTRLQSLPLQVRLREWLSMDFAAAICELQRRSNRCPSAIGCFGICLSRPGRRLCMLIRFSRMRSSCTFHSRCIYSIWPFYWTVYGNRQYFFQTMYTVTVKISNLLELRSAQRDNTPCTAPKLDFWTWWRENKTRNWFTRRWSKNTGRHRVEVIPSQIQKPCGYPGSKSSPPLLLNTIQNEVLLSYWTRSKRSPPLLMNTIQTKSSRSSPTEHDPNEVLLSYWTRSKRSPPLLMNTIQTNWP